MAEKKNGKSPARGKGGQTSAKKPASSRKKAPKAPSSDYPRIARVVLGLVCSLATIYTVVALISYFFTWSSDQSLAFNPDAFTMGASAANSGGQLGWKWADFLVSKLFGLGAFAVPVFMGAIAVNCFRIRKVNLLRCFIVCLFGAILFSVLFAYIFGFTKFDTLLGNGAGGSYGHYANKWLCNIAGYVGAGFILAVGLFIFVLLLSPKVAYWFDDLIYGAAHREKPVPAAAGEVDAPVSGPLFPVEDDPLDEESGPEPDPEESVAPAIGSNPMPFPVRKPAAQASPEEGRDDAEGPVSPFPYPQKRPVIGVPPSATVNHGTVSTPPQAAADDVPLSIEESKDTLVAGSPEDDVVDYDPRLDLPKYKFPPMSLLDDYRNMWFEVSREELEENKQRIVNALDSYKIKVKAITAQRGPTVTLYKIHLADGVKVAQVRNLEEDIAISLGAKGVRVVTLIDSVGIEVANEKPSVVPLKAVLNCQQFKQKSQDMEIPLALGITVTNEPFFIDLAKMPHLLVAGATGQGKSVGLNCIITSMLYTKHPAELKLVMVDPKAVEFQLYEKLDKHYLAMLPDGDEAIITDTRKVVNTLKSLCIEMEERYALLKKADVRQIKEYNAKFLNRRLNPNHGHKFLPYIVVIIDEFADLLMTAGREIEEPIARLAQKARAAGIHLIIATQRPTTNIITGTIKANFNSRIAFKVNASVDSKVILDASGANRLIGRGDMLVVYPGHDMARVQCALVDTDEIKNIVGFVNDQRGYAGPFLLPEVVDDSEDASAAGSPDLHHRDQLFDECAKMVVQYQQGSTSMLQRKLGVGYARAGRIMDQLETAGIVGPQDGSKARSVLVSDFDTLDRILESLNHI